MSIASGRYGIAGCHHPSTLPAYLIDVEILSGAFRRLGLAMTEHTIGRDVVRLHQIGNELLQRLDLGLGRMGHVKIAYEANADAEIIKPLIRRPGVRTPFLNRPAGAHFDLSVARVCAIADDEIVTAIRE